jgi:hypothetical protein
LGVSYSRRISSIRRTAFLFALWRLEEVKGGEKWKILPLQEYQGGLDPAVGQKEVAAELRQGASIFRHLRLLIFDSSLRPAAPPTIIGPPWTV